MKKFFLASLVLTLVMAFSLSAQDKKEVKDQKTTTKTVVTEKTELNTICPVSGEEADPKITATYEGKTYALCCKTCLKKFNKDPEKYINKMNQKKVDNK